MLLFTPKNEAIVKLYNTMVIRAIKGKAAAFNPLIVQQEPQFLAA